MLVMHYVVYHDDRRTMWIEGGNGFSNQNAAIVLRKKICLFTKYSII